MKTSKIFKIVILPTNKASELVLSMWENINKLAINKDLKNDLSQFTKDLINQHLYIISNDEIKEGDWYITLRKDYQGVLNKCVKLDKVSVISQLNNSNNPNHTQYTEFKFAKKIIASTDKDLVADYDIKPIPKSFIQAYINAYNKGNPINEVNLEMKDNSREEWIGDKYTGEPVWIEDLQINIRNDNTIIIHQSKTYSREEVISIITKLNEQIDKISGGLALGINSLEKYIEENLN